MAPISQSVSRPARRWRADPMSRVMVFAPFAVALYYDTLGRPIFGGMFAKPPEMIGLPVGIWLQLAFLGWAAAAAAIVWTTSSRFVSALALVFGTIVALFGIVIGPAVILVLQNLAS